jgi:F0F1-type ATP synthase assembly protein I
MVIASQLALSLAVSVLLGFLAGRYLDSLLATGPVFMIVGSLLGMVAGLTGSVQLARAMARKQAERKQRPQP